MKDYVKEIQYRNAHENDIDFNFPFDENSIYSEILDVIEEMEIETIKERIE